MYLKHTQISLLLSLWRHLSIKRHNQLILLIYLTIITAAIEIICLGAAVPFFGALTNPSSILENKYIKPLLLEINISATDQLLLPLTLTFGIATLSACVMRLLLLWTSTKLAHAIGADLSSSIYRRTLYQPYKMHCSRNSSEIISGISIKTNSTIASILNTLNFISSSIILIVLAAALVFINPFESLLILCGFGLIYSAVILLTRKKQSRLSAQIADQSTATIKTLQEGLGGIREVLINGSQEIFSNIYRDSNTQLRRAQGLNNFIASSPRHLVEAFGVLLLTGMAFYLANQTDGVNKAIPTLGVLAIGAQRILPLLQLSYASWVGIRGEKASLNDTLVFLNLPISNYLLDKNNNPLPFENSIEIKELFFQYENDLPLVLKKLNFIINKGDRVGIVGPTGSGKSTLVDILTGLIESSSGSFKVDGIPITKENARSWQSNIAHVPQTIFLADATISENIAFGIPKSEIDVVRMTNAAKSANIDEVIESMKYGYNTLVGERGVRLSGGQRQRIGIARAVYKNAKVIFFDEATSALDNHMESEVMKSINSFGDYLTIIIVAHRITTLKSCNKIIKLDKNGGFTVVSYHDL